MYLQDGGDGLVISFTNGAVFSPKWVDLAEYSYIFPIPATIPFIGYRTNGTTVTNMFITDGIIGVPGQSDFQTFQFGPEFSGLSRVEIPYNNYDGWALDNLLLTYTTPPIVPLVGPVVAWGQNQIGESTFPPGLSNVVAIAASTGSSAALRSDGTVNNWGLITYIGTNIPPGLSNVVAIAAGGFFEVGDYMLALKPDGTVVGWGWSVPPAGLSSGHRGGR